MKVRATQMSDSQHNIKTTKIFTVYLFTFVIIQEYILQNTTTNYEHRYVFVNQNLFIVVLKIL